MLQKTADVVGAQHAAVVERMGPACLAWTRGSRADGDGQGPALMAALCGAVRWLTLAAEPAGALFLQDNMA